MLDFNQSIFATDYSFSSPRSIIRTLSDAFSKQFCDTKGAIKYAVIQTKGCCIYCGKPMYEVKHKKPHFSNTIHYDHVYAASKLNLFEVGNVAIACNTCNLAKSDRMPMDYYDIRTQEGGSLYLYDKEEFEQFLHRFTKPYREKWPEHYAAGTRIIEDDDEFKELLLKLLFLPVDIASASSKYNYENSVNRLIWERVIKKAYESYQPLTAKDVEGRIGYTNAMFEDNFGHTAKLEDLTIKDLNEFFRILLLSKYESKNEIQKYRMLIKMLVEVLNEDIMQGQLDDFYKEIPTYAKLGKETSPEL